MFKTLTERDWNSLWRFNCIYDPVTRTKCTLEEIISKELTFTDKQSYLQWIDVWKVIYKELSSNIRFHKKNRKSRFQLNELERWESESKARYLGYQAFVMMYLRTVAKEFSKTLKQQSITV